MERLTQRVLNYHAVTLDACKHGCAKGNKMDCPRCKPLTNALFKLAEYEDAEEQGLLYRTHGLWIKINDGFYFDFKCSVCGNLNEFARNYCPNCGAKMDLKQALEEMERKNG